MARLTRDKIQKILGSQIIGNYSSLTSIGRVIPNNEPKNNLENRALETVSKPLARMDPLAVNKIVNDLLVENHIVSEPLAKTVRPTLSETVSDPLASKESFLPVVNVFEPEKDSSEEIRNATTATSVGEPLALNKEITREWLEKDHAFQQKASLKTSDINLAANSTRIKSKETVSKSLAHEGVLEFNSAHILAGKEFILVMYLIDLCQKNCSLITPPVFTNDLIKNIVVKPNHLRNIILRLCAKKIFKVLLHKSSRHAVRIFEFDKDTYTTLIGRKSNEKETNVLTNTKHKQIENQHNIFTAELDLTPLEVIGFNESHIIQIYKEYEKNPNLELSKEMIQDSINAFAFDLKHNNTENSFRNSPAVVLLSLLKKGMPYSSKTPDKFLAPKEEAMKNYLEAKNKQMQTKRIMEDQLKKVSFDEWFDNVKEEDLKEFYPDHSKLNGIPIKLRDTLLKKEALKNIKDHFDANIWPTLQEKLELIK